MDYEVFVVTRMREVWDETGDNARAVAVGLERTGRIVTAAALIMAAAFCGFLAGSVTGLRQLGLALALGVVLDATLVRSILVPALMAVLRGYNWWLPAPSRASSAWRPRRASGERGWGGAEGRPTQPCPLGDDLDREPEGRELVAGREPGRVHRSNPSSGTMPSCGYGYAGCCV